MALKIILALFLACLSAQAAGTNRVLTFGWNWQPRPLDMGGLTTNDYFTNIVFRLYSTTNIATPVWVKYAEVPASSALAQGIPGSEWTNTVSIDTATRFFYVTVYSSAAQGSGESPPSNVLFQYAPLPAGTLLYLK